MYPKMISINTTPYCEKNKPSYVYFKHIKNKVKCICTNPQNKNNFIFTTWLESKENKLQKNNGRIDGVSLPKKCKKAIE